MLFQKKFTIFSNQFLVAKLALSIVLLMMLSLNSYPVSAKSPTSGSNQGNTAIKGAGTTLSATVTGEGFRIEKQNYDWSLTKLVDNDHLFYEPNKPLNLLYTL